METTPVVIEALGLVKKGLDKVTSRIPGNINTNKIQNMTPTSMWDTAVTDAVKL